MLLSLFFFSASIRIRCVLQLIDKLRTVNYITYNYNVVKKALEAHLENKAKIGTFGIGEVTFGRLSRRSIDLSVYLHEVSESSLK